MLNYAAGQLPFNLVSTLSGADGWDPTYTGLENHRVALPTTGVTTVYERFSLWIDPDVQQLDFRGRMTLPASNTGRLELDVGGGSINLDFAAGGTTNQSSTIATSTTGTGWLGCQIRVRKLTGTAITGAILEGFRIRTSIITASNLPDPDPLT